MNRCEQRACRFSDEQEFFSKLLFQIHLVQVTPGGDAEENKENAGEIPSWIFLTTTDVQSFLNTKNYTGVRVCYCLILLFVVNLKT